jgi:hypothetical protein
VSDPQYPHCCGAHVFTGTPSPLDSGAVMFTFVGHDRIVEPLRVPHGRCIRLVRPGYVW